MKYRRYVVISTPKIISIENLCAFALIIISMISDSQCSPKTLLTTLVQKIFSKLWRAICLVRMPSHTCMKAYYIPHICNQKFYLQHSVNKVCKPKSHIDALPFLETNLSFSFKSYDHMPVANFEPYITYLYVSHMPSYAQSHFMKTSTQTRYHPLVK